MSSSSLKEELKRMEESARSYGRHPTPTELATMSREQKRQRARLWARQFFAAQAVNHMTDDGIIPMWEAVVREAAQADDDLTSMTAAIARASASAIARLEELEKEAQATNEARKKEREQRNGGK